MLGDTIDLAGLAFTGQASPVVAGNTVSVTEGGVTEVLTIAKATGTTVTLASDGAGGTMLTDTTARAVVVSSGMVLTVSVLVPARLLVNASSIVLEGRLDRVDYYHIELDQHRAIWAEGAASQTFPDDDSRAMFHNASDYAELYPDARPRGGFTAPRVESGYLLEAIRDKLARVAGRRVQLG